MSSIAGASGNSSSHQRNLNPLIIIGCLFFIFGFVTWVSAVLIPYLQIACELNNFQSYLVAFAFYISYFVMALPSGRLLKYTGYKKGIAWGLAAVAAGSAIFIPAAIYRIYGIFLGGLFVQGAGLALLQTAANPYVTILGPLESGAKRMSIMGICNGVAGILAPVVLGAVILDNADELVNGLNRLGSAEKIRALDELALRVIKPYFIISVLLVVLAMLVYRSSLPEVDNPPDEAPVSAGNTVRSGILDFPHLLLGVLALFLYVGVEVIAGNTIVGYGTYQHIPLSAAKFFSSFTLTGMLVGYLVGIIFIPKYLSQRIALAYCALLGIVFVLLALFTRGWISVLFIALLGLSNSLMFPSIWPLAIDGLGKFTKTGASLLVMAISGGAVLPLLYGMLADHFNARHAYWMVVPCYLVIGYYALAGYKAGRRVGIP
jgi:glucose/galactose transporter